MKTFRPARPQEGALFKRSLHPEKRSESAQIESEAIVAAADAYMADAVWRALVSVKRLQKFRQLLAQCPNYIWDATVEVIGSGNPVSAVEWLIHGDLNLHATRTPIEIAVHGDPDLVMQRLGRIEFDIYS